jgi:hypothetical protein
MKIMGRGTKKKKEQFKITALFLNFLLSFYQSILDLPFYLLHKYRKF